MDNKYNMSQKLKTLEKLFDAGFDTEKKIVAMQMDDLVKLPNLASHETIIIIEFKRAIKDKKLIVFFSGKDEEKKGDDK